VKYEANPVSLLPVHVSTSAINSTSQHLDHSRSVFFKWHGVRHIAEKIAAFVREKCRYPDKTLARSKSRIADRCAAQTHHKFVRHRIIHLELPRSSAELCITGQCDVAENEIESRTRTSHRFGLKFLHW